MDRVLFSEMQYFRQWWLWLILLVATAVTIILFVFGIYTQQVLGKQWGTNPASTLSLVLLLILNLLLMGGLILLFYKMCLLVEIRTSGVWFRFPPLSFGWKSYIREEIANYEIRTYCPASEYSGWGIKGTGKNRAYNVSGNVGLQLYLKDGKKVLFGTQQKQVIQHAMRKMMNSERIE